MTDNWWAPREIVFTREQVVWLLSWLPLLREGSWPPRPTNYQDVKVDKQPSHHAYFEVPVQIAAELLSRLDRTGQDGAMCKMWYVYGEDIDSIARHWHTTGEVVRSRINRAVNFCCGWRRKVRYWQRW